MICRLCHSNIKIFCELNIGEQWKLYNRPATDQNPLVFYKCESCQLVCKDPNIWLSFDNEKVVYDQHDNSLNETNQNYMSGYLKLAENYIGVSSAVLDFGCGSHKAIETLLAAQNIKCDSYDIHYFNNLSWKEKKYHFIFCIETIEHVKNPSELFDDLYNGLNENGTLLIVTRMVPELFRDWYYHKDPTHIHFYSDSTFSYIEKNWRLKRMAFSDKWIILQKV